MPADDGWPFRVVGDTNVYVAAVLPREEQRAVGAGFPCPPSEDFIVRAVDGDFVLLMTLSCFLDLTEKVEEFRVPRPAAARGPARGLRGRRGDVLLFAA